MINYDKYIKSTGTHYISNTGHDERGQYKGGAAGDQGGEYTLRSWYNRPWSVVLRWPDQSQALLAAQMAIEAALNDCIGYDQNQRSTFWTALAKVGYVPADIKTKCETDCTASTTAIWKGVGYRCDVPSLKALGLDTYSGNMKSRFVKAGFTALTQSKYVAGHQYLLPGDVLLYEGHHAAINVTIGSAVRGDWHPGDTPSQDYKLGDRTLQRGDSGSDVKELQEDLVKLGYSFPKYGCDGDFGVETEANVKGFQRLADIEVDGIFGPESYKALMKMLDGLNRYVEITGDSVNVRKGPGTLYDVIGVAHKGDKLPYGGEQWPDGDRIWYLVEFEGQNGCVSSKLSKLVEG
jgi:hypothetical protein